MRSLTLSTAAPNKQYRCEGGVEKDVMLCSIKYQAQQTDYGCSRRIVNSYLGLIYLKASCCSNFKYPDIAENKKEQNL